MEAVSTVMVLALAAVVLFFFRSTLWPHISPWLSQQILRLTSGE